MEKWKLREIKGTEQVDPGEGASQVSQALRSCYRAWSDGVLDPNSLTRLSGL